MRYLGPVVGTALAVIGMATVLVGCVRMPSGLRALSGVTAVVLAAATVRISLSHPVWPAVPLGLSAAIAALNALRPTTPRVREGWLYRALTYTPRTRRPR